MRLLFVCLLTFLVEISDSALRDSFTKHSWWHVWIFLLIFRRSGTHSSCQVPGLYADWSVVCSVHNKCTVLQFSTNLSYTLVLFCYFGASSMSETATSLMVSSLFWLCLLFFISEFASAVDSVSARGVLFWKLTVCSVPFLCLTSGLAQSAIFLTDVKWSCVILHPSKIDSVHVLRVDLLLKRSLTII